MLDQERRAESLFFQGDVLLSSQYFDALRRAEVGPEKKLMLTMLDDAVGCVRKYALAGGERERGLFARAQAWIADERNNWIFSFVSVCESLGVDPGYLRRGLMDWQEKVATLKSNRQAENDCPGSEAIATAPMSRNSVELEETDFSVGSPPWEEGVSEEVGEEVGTEAFEEEEKIESTDPLSVYLREVASIPPLSREQEAELWRQQEEVKASYVAEIFSIPFSWHFLLEIAGKVEKEELCLADVLIDVAPAEEKQKRRDFLKQIANLRRLTGERVSLPEEKATPGAVDKRAEILYLINGLGLSDSRIHEIAQKVKDGVVRLANLERTDLFGSETRRSAEELGLKAREGRERLRSIEKVEDRIASIKHELTNGNLRLVLWVAKRHAHRGIPLLDIIQLGNMGLMRAQEKFDYRRGFRFSTYAVPWIRQSIARGIVDTIPTIRIPAHLAETRTKILRTYTRMGRELGRDPSGEEVAEALGIGLSEIRNAMSTVGEPVSLHTPVGEEGEASIMDFMEDRFVPEPQQRAFEDDVRAKVRAALSTLPEREEKIIRLRFGIGETRDHTLEEVGEAFSITRERIRQLEQQAVRKLRLPAEEREL